MFVIGCVGGCICVCVCEREKKRERESENLSNEIYWKTIQAESEWRLKISHYQREAHPRWDKRARIESEKNSPTSLPKKDSLYNKMIILPLTSIAGQYRSKEPRDGNLN